MAAQLVGCGKTTVPISGTPVPIAIPSEIAGPATPGLSSVHAILVQALSTNAGKVYIGTQGMSKAALTKTLVVLPVPTANVLPTFSISLTAGANALSLNDIWIDVDNAGEGVLVSAVLA